MDFIDHRPAVPSTAVIGTGRAAVMLGVDDVERELGGDPPEPATAAAQPAGVRSKSATVFHHPVAGWSRRCATTTSTPRGLRARRILIGSIAVPSYSPGIGNDVTIRTRIGSGSILHGVMYEPQR